MNEYKHPSEFKSCDTCDWPSMNKDNRWGCPWRSEITMFEDKSPCLNWSNMEEKT